MNKFILTLSILFLNSLVKAQEVPVIQNPPVIVELLASNNGLVMQSIMNKRFQSAPRFGFFSVSSLISDWNENKLKDFMNQSSLTFELFKGLSLTSGYHYTQVTGFRGAAGLLYGLKKNDWNIVLYPRIDLAAKGNVEGLAIVEYTPKINEKLAFYSRLQTLYTIDLDHAVHQRSSYIARAGVSHKEFVFGLGANLDYFGPMKDRVSNVGLFGSFNLF